MFSIPSSQTYPQNTIEGTGGTPSQPGIDSRLETSTTQAGAPEGGAAVPPAANETYAARTGIDPHMYKYLLPNAGGLTGGANGSAPTQYQSEMPATDPAAGAPAQYQSETPATDAATDPAAVSTAAPTTTPTATPAAAEQPAPECDPRPESAPAVPAPTAGALAEETPAATPPATAAAPAAPTPEPGVTEVQVDIVNFIPYEEVPVDPPGWVPKQVPDLVPVTEWPPVDADVTVKGDGRDPGLDASGGIGSYRALQSVIVREGPGGGQPVVTTVTDTGDTHEIRNGEEVHTGTASGDSLTACYEVEDDGTVVVHASGSEVIPRIVAPAITYNTELRFTPDGNGGYDVSINGSHDNFPGYEVFVSANGGERELVYSSDPRETGGDPYDLVTNPLTGPSQKINERVGITAEGEIIDETQG